MSLAGLKTKAASAVLGTVELPLDVWKVANSTASRAIGTTGRITGTTFSLADAALDVTAKAAENSAKVSGNLLDLAGTSSTAATSLAGNAITGASGTTNVALNSAFTVANQSMEAATHAVGALVKTVDGFSTSVIASKDRNKASDLHMNNEWQIRNLSNKFKENFDHQIDLVAKSLKKYIIDQPKFVKQSLVALEQKRCAHKSTMFRSYYQCDEEMTSTMEKFKADLDFAVRLGYAAVEKLTALKSKYAAVVSPFLADTQNDLNWFLTNFKKATASLYEDASNTSVGIFKLFTKLDEKIIQEYERVGGRKTRRNKNKKRKRQTKTKTKTKTKMKLKK